MRLQPGLLQLGNTLLAAGLSGQQLFQEVLVAGLVYAGVTEFGFYLCVFLVGASQLLLQFVSSLLQRRQALPDSDSSARRTQCTSSSAISAASGTSTQLAERWVDP